MLSGTHPRSVHTDKAKSSGKLSKRFEHNSRTLTDRCNMRAILIVAPPLPSVTADVGPLSLLPNR
jgi:hypothetical protein